VTPFLPDSISVASLTGGAEPVVEAFLAVILLTLGVSLGIWGIGFVVSVIQRTLATANSGSGSTRRSTGFGRHG
jgi:hypothetical protein